MSYTELTSIASRKIHTYILLIIGAGCFVYANSLFNTFVWDDLGYVFSSPFTRPLYTLKDIFIAQGQAMYRPFFYIYLNIISVLSQGHAGIIHFVQIILHITNAVLIFHLFRRFMRQSIALCLSLIFVVHPINVEAVAYISAVGNPLMFLFGITGILLLSNPQIRIRQYGIAGVLFLTALLTYEAAISFLCIAVLYAWLYKKYSLPLIASFTMPGIGYGLLQVFVSQASFHKYNYVPIAVATIGERFLTMPKILAYYLSTVLYPVRMSVAQHWTVTSISFRDVLFPLLLDCGIIVLFVVGGLYIVRHKASYIRPYLFFAAWFMFGIAPFMQIIPVDMTVADRWFYMPFVGLLGMTGLIIQTAKYTRMTKIAGIIFFCIIIGLLSARTIVRNANWRNGITLFSHDVQKNPDSFDIHAKLASELYTAKQHDKAMHHATIAVRLQPDDITSLGTLALLYLEENNPKQAIIYLQKLLEQDPDNYLGITNLIYAYLLSGDTKSADEYIHRGLLLYPDDPSLVTFQSIKNEKFTSPPR